MLAPWASSFRGFIPPSWARAALEVMKFPPLGHRGFGLRAIVTDLTSDTAQDEVNSANQETMAILMIESKDGLRT